MQVTQVPKTAIWRHVRRGDMCDPDQIPLEGYDDFTGEDTRVELIRQARGGDMQGSETWR